MARKSSRILVGLVCEECKTFNYVTEINTQNTKSIVVKKYCPKEKTHKKHTMKKKLK